MDEYELYPGQHTGEQIDQAVDVVQAAILEAAQETTPSVDAVVAAVDASGAKPYSVAGADISTPDAYGDTTLPTRPLLVSCYRELKLLARNKCIKAVFSGVSSLPQTVSQLPGYNTIILDDADVISMRLSNPSAQAGAWTVTAEGRSVTVSGSISGTTDIEIYLAVPGETIE